MSRRDNGHVTDILLAYVGGTLTEREDRRIRKHLTSCGACRAEAASWEAVSGAVTATSELSPAPPEGIMAGVWAEIELETPGRTSRAFRPALAWQLLRGQLPLVRKKIWVASAATMALGLLVALLAATPTAAGLTLALLAPALAAIGVALLYGPENDPSLEVALSTPTSPWTVLLARLTLVYGYDLILALAASGVLAAWRGFALWPLISLWITPMLFLSALALLVSIIAGPSTAVVAAMSLWGTRLIAGSLFANGVGSAGADLLQNFWQADLVLLALAAALLVVALFHGPRMERLA